MASLTLTSLFSTLFSVFVLLFHLGCFNIFASADHRSRKRKASSPGPASSPSPSPSRLKKAHKALSSSWSSLRGIFSTSTAQTHPGTPSVTSARSSLVPPETHLSDGPINPWFPHESDISAENPFLPLRNDIFPCTICGEIFPKAHLLEQHQSIKHAVSEMTDSDAGKNIVRIIFKAGWTDTKRRPEIHRILKIHNSQKILARFEEYRELVKAKARACCSERRDERCVADGNELLRFQCALFSCDLGLKGKSSICNHHYCSVCGIIRSGFSPKMDGIATLSGSWRAHVSVPEELEEDFSFINVKRAMLVSRVVAGRVGCDTDDLGGGFDSVGSASLDDELLVFNPRAVLPCFLIVYTACAN